MFFFQFKVRKFLNEMQKITKMLMLLKGTKGNFLKRENSGVNKNFFLINNSVKVLEKKQQMLGQDYFNIKKFFGFSQFQRDSNFLNYLSAETIALYFKNEIEKSYKKKDFFFKKGPKRGVEKFLQTLYYVRQKNPMISGNWVGAVVVINGR